MKQLADISRFESIMNLRPIKYNGLVIRRIKPKEIAQQHDLDRECFKSTYIPPKRELLDKERSLKANPGNDIIVGAFDGKKMVGYASFTVEDTGIGCDAEWDHAAVLPKYQGQELQKVMGYYAEQLLPERVKTIGTTIWRGNVASYKNADRLGYKKKDGVTFDDNTPKEPKKLDLLIKDRRYGDLIIRPIQPREIPQMAEIRKTCFGDWGDRDSFIKRSKKDIPGNSTVVGAFDGSKLVGYVDISPAGNKAWPYADQRWASACVLPEYRGRGLQRALHDSAIRLLSKNAKTIGTVINPNNIPSYKNALRLGYKVAKKGMFRDGKDPLDLLIKRLGNEEAR